MDPKQIDNPETGARRPRRPPLISIIADETTLEDLDTEPMFINIGPTHPATHGTFRVFCKLDGERIEKAAVEIGYLHRGFEKIVETKHYTQVIPYTDRLNYCSGLVNNVGYCKAVERMLGVTITPRTEIIRVIICEIQRIMDHMICVCANLVDIGALTNFWYFFNAREKTQRRSGGAHRGAAHLLVHPHRRARVGSPEGFEANVRRQR